MGYNQLRPLLRLQGVSLRQVATETGINLDRLYNLTAAHWYLSPPEDFTTRERGLIYYKYFEGTVHSMAEVFSRNESNEYRFVFKDRGRR